MPDPSQTLAQIADFAARSDRREPALLSELATAADFGSPLFWALLALFTVCVTLLVFQHITIRRFINYGAGTGRGLDHEERTAVIDSWSSYGQFGICIFLVFCVTVMLILRVISAEAGLTILSGISGFAVARSSGFRDGRAATPPPAKTADHPPG
jgi:hypothetical protein